MAGADGLTRGLPTEQVPWASVIDPKTGEKKAKIKPVSTGLWSRYGNPIMAPDWWLNQLPCCPLDGELWAGRGKFQLCRSICGGDTPDERFDRIVFAVYSTPPLGAIFRCLAALRERGYGIRSVHDAKGWTYEIVAEPAQVSQKQDA
jgi:hypothetical protein